MNPLKVILPVLFSGFVTTGLAQGDSFQNIYFTRKKQEQPVFGKADYLVAGEKSFYLYRNCIYDLVLKNKLMVSVQIVDIKNDSIYYALNMNMPQDTGQKDTLSLHPSSIKRIRLIGDRTVGLYKGIRLRQYRYRWESAAEPKKFTTSLRTVYAPDSSSSTTYELLPFMTAQGLDQVYQQCGKSYYYEGSITPAACTDSVKETRFIRKDWIWFTPSNANEIRGINLGLQTDAGNDSLVIRGLNIGVDLLSVFGGMVLLAGIASDNALINMPDTVDASRQTRMHGISLSFGGLAMDQVRGISLNGFVYMVNETKGLVITAFQNIAADFTGILISPLRNKSITGKGVQIGALNICKHLKGIQIGLWNVNSKRKLPFINWSF